MRKQTIDENRRCPKCGKVENQIKKASTPICGIKVYLMRWRIEEYFRFKKQQYDFEDFRVRSLNSIRTLHRMLTLLAGLIGVLSEKRYESLFVMELINASKRIYPPKPEKAKRKFLHYAIGDGIFAILRRCSVGFASFLKTPLPSSQTSFIAFLA